MTIPLEGIDSIYYYGFMEDVSTNRNSIKFGIIITVILSITPFLIFASWPAKDQSTNDYMTFATSIFGLIGAVLMLWQFILGTRVLIRYLFPDMVWALKLHRWLGTYGSLFTWFHPLLGMFSLGASLWYIFVPDISSSYELHMTYGRVAFLLFITVWVTSAVVRGRIKYRPWKYLHLSSYILLPFVFLHGVANGVQLAQSKFLLYYWYALIAVYICLLAVRIGYQFGYGKRPYIITGAKTNGDLTLLTLKPEVALPEAMVTTRPGQYVYMQFDKLFSESHPFTVAYYDYNTHEMTIAIKSYGKFTKKILELNKGEQLLIDGPYGVFTEELIADNTSQPIVMFAGGIGITPFIQHIFDGRNQDVTLFNCNQNVQNTVFSDALRSRLKQKYIDVFSRARTRTNRPNTELGRISPEIVRKYLDQSPENYTYFICGHKEFMDAVMSILDQFGVPKKQIKTEEFSF